jgi:hypothetical protein
MPGEPRDASIVPSKCAWAAQGRFDRSVEVCLGSKVALLGRRTCAWGAQGRFDRSVEVCLGSPGTLRSSRRSLPGLLRCAFCTPQTRSSQAAALGGVGPRRARRPEAGSGCSPVGACMVMCDRERARADASGRPAVSAWSLVTERARWPEAEDGRGGPRRDSRRRARPFCPPPSIPPKGLRTPGCIRAETTASSCRYIPGRGLGAIPRPCIFGLRVPSQPRTPFARVRTRRVGGPAKTCVPV